MPHSTYYDSNHKEIPSVTQILKVLNKKGLMEWSNMLGFKRINYNKFLNGKALLGTLLHDRISCYFSEKEYVPYIDESIESNVDKLFQNFIAWVNENQIHCLMSEKQFTNENYGGTLDFYGTIEGTKTALIDFKTSKKIYATQLLQLGGYLNLIESCDKKMHDSIDLCQIVAIREDKVLITSKTMDEMKVYKEAFTAVYKIYSIWDSILKNEWGESVL